jgi:hypothetical protein
MTYVPPVYQPPTLFDRVLGRAHHDCEYCLTGAQNHPPNHPAPSPPPLPAVSRTWFRLADGTFGPGDWNPATEQVDPAPTLTTAEAVNARLGGR